MGVKLALTGIAFIFALNQVIVQLGGTANPMSVTIGAFLLVIGAALSWLEK